MPTLTPFHVITTTGGAGFTEVDGWSIPHDFGDSNQEYEQACQATALFDISHHGKVELAGPEAEEFLNNLCTNDVMKLADGNGCEAFLTSNQAKTLAYVLVYKHQSVADGTTFWLDAGPGMGDGVAKHLDRYLISEQVAITDRTQEFGQVHLAGPRAREALEAVLLGESLHLGELQHTKANVGGSAIFIRSHRPLGLPGYDILVPRDDATAIWQTLVEKGATPAGMESYQTLRVEAGTPQFGIDIDETNLPQEVGREGQAISFAKGCYIGQETIARIRTYGHVNQSLVGLVLEGQGTEPPGTKLFRNGKEVGHLTSCVHSPKLRSVIALGYARRGNQEPGTALEVQGAVSRTAAVHELPFAAFAHESTS
jgi:folate-binding protein YgfZ